MQDTSLSVAPSASGTPASTPTQLASPPEQVGGGTDMASGLLSTALALAFVLVLAWSVLRVVKRVQQGKGRPRHAGAQAPELLHSLSLGPNQRLITVQYDGRQYLLGVTATAIQLLEASQRPDLAPGNRTP